MQTKLVGVLGIVLLLCAAQTAEAQQRGRGRGFGGRGLSVLSVAAVPEAAAELQLSDEQTAAAKKLSDEYNAARSSLFAGFRDLSDDQRQAKMQEYREQTAAKEKQLAEAVGEEKFKRLGQLALQTSGLAIAVFNDEVAEKLGVTEDQQTQIREASRDYFGQLRDADDAERAKLAASLNEKVRSSLNEEQLKAWKEMVGEPASDELIGKIRAASRGGGRRST